MSDAETLMGTEAKALEISKWGNLGMGLAGALAAWLSHSNALMVDGLFSLIGFAAAVAGRQVSTAASRAPDKQRPLGYAAEEAVFVVFRALSLLGLVVFAVANSGIGITNYVITGEAPELRYGVMVIYFCLILCVCAGLTIVHRRAWVRTGKRSDILRLEGQAAFFDGLITFAAALGLLCFPLLADTALAPIVPVGDNIVVLVLCGLVVGRYWADFRGGLSELIGVTAKPATVAAVNDMIIGRQNDIPGAVREVAVLKLGRLHEVIVSLAPSRPVSGSEIDAVVARLEPEITEKVGMTRLTFVISDIGRPLHVGPGM